ncbi:MAG: holin, BlyA family protein [Lachnospiraceae bacterium]|nr:holin, BlyA family protein [Lachnospiraceae bacterium]
MNLMKRFIEEEDGLSTVEIILILVVLVGLVLIFKEERIQIVESVFKTITKQINKV